MVTSLAVGHTSSYNITNLQPFNFLFLEKKKETENHLKCNTQQNHKVLRRIKAAASSSVEEQHGEQQLL